jgi:hypothetical protein
VTDAPVRHTLLDRTFFVVLILKGMDGVLELVGGVLLLFVTPEHNRSIPAVLKNAIDWGARPYGQNSWSGKPAAITGTSPGALGN